MSTTVSMPQLGETVTEGTILRWAKSVGDTVAEDEVLVEISTDKVDTEVPSPASGTITEILVPEGETVAVGSPLVVIGDAGEEPADGRSESTPEQSQPEPAQDAEPAPAPAGSEPAEESAAPEPAAPAAEGGGSGDGTTVSMPQLGETVTEGTILRWAKSVGDTVAEDEVLVEISTDKVDTEVPSPASGTITEILVPEGETVAVGTALVVIGGGGGAATGAPSATQAAEPAAEPAPAAESGEAAPSTPSNGSSGASVELSGRLLSPVVRKLVREHDIDIDRITGTGQGGRVTRKDVEAHIESGAAGAPTEQPVPQPAAAAAPEPAPSAPPPAPAQPPTTKAAAPAPSPVAASAEDEVVDLDRLRVRIGQNMIRSKQTAAHVWTSVEVDYEAIERVRQRHKEAFKSEEGFSLTYLPFIARATVDALREYPVVNSEFHLEQRQAVFHKSVHLGIAIDLDQKGLVVASVRNADGLRLVGLARQIRALATKARDNKLEPDDVTGSSFTITNPGPFGSFMSAPIINIPNTGILSTDTVAKRPAVVTSSDGEDVLAIRHIGYLGLTWDHRAFDGSTAVLFLQRIKQNLETWDWEQELT